MYESEHTIAWGHKGGTTASGSTRVYVCNYVGVTGNTAGFIRTKAITAH